MLRLLKIAVNRKLAAMCALLAVLICVGTCIIGYIVYRDSLYKSANDFAYQLDEIARTYVNGDRILSYLETGTEDAEYRAMAENIYTLYRNTSLYDNKAGIYICVPNAAELTITNLYDVRIEEYLEDDRYEVFGIGVTDPMGIEHPENAIRIYETGERVDDYFVHKTRFGYNSSAMLPVYNSEGEIVALIVTDMPIPYLTESLNRFLFSTIITTVIIVFLFMIGFLFIADKLLSRPLQIISEEADSFTRTEIQLSQRLPQIHQKDEIGHLAESVYKMEKDIQSYVENLTAVTAEKERIGAELDVAQHIQAAMLPCIFPAFPERHELDIYATMDPAKEVGGDFYDFFMVDDRHLAIVMADVSGKGVPAALFMVIGKTLIKDHTQLHKDDLGEVFTEVNQLLCESNSEDLFITAFEGILDLVTGEFTYVNAGHEMPFISRGGGDFQVFKIRAAFVLAGMEGMQYQYGTMMLEPGDRLYQYTDGVTEASDDNNGFFGMERLEASLNAHKGDSVKDLLIHVKQDIDAFAGKAPQYDDITMLCLEYRERMQEKPEQK